MASLDDLATIIRDHLATRTEITDIVGDRLLDFDYRVPGWNTAPVTVYDGDSLLLPTIIVDAVDSSRPLELRPAGAEHPLIYVWAFAARTTTRVAAVRDLMTHTKRALIDFQDPETRAMVFWNYRLGPIMADDGVFARNEFRCAGIERREE